MRSTPASVHSRPVPPGRNSPSTSRPSAVSRDEHGFGDGGAEAVARGEVGRGERRVRARVAQREVAERIARPAASSDSGMPAGSGTPSASR